MKFVRVGYLAFVAALSCAHMFVMLSPWTAPALAAGGMETSTAVWFVVLFAAWIVAVAVDLVLSVLEVLPLSFAGEAILCNVSLAVLLSLDGGIVYVLCALTPPTIVLIRVLEEISGHGHQPKPI